jgi:hypothetical protein
MDAGAAELNMQDIVVWGQLMSSLLSCPLLVFLHHMYILFIYNKHISLYNILWSFVVLVHVSMMCVCVSYPFMFKLALVQQHYLIIWPSS